MSTERLLLKTVINYTEDGIIYIDRMLEFRLINHKAKEILGLVLERTQSHPAGKIQVGDIVIIADNLLGEDDGGMTPEDLKLINVHDPDIRQRDLFIGIGVYQDQKIQPVYKYIRSANLTAQVELEADFLGVSIHVQMNLADGYTRVRANDISHQMKFFHSIGDLLIIDGKTGQLKFFQAKGYSMRKESIKEIFLGQPFLSKGDCDESLNIIGSKVESMINTNEWTEKLQAMLAPDAAPILEKLYEINKRLTLCSFIPVRDEEQAAGVLLMIRDASDLDEMIRRRNEILEKVEDRQFKVAPPHQTAGSSILQDFIGNSSAIREVKYLADKASRSKINVLLTGESGTGKSRLAYEIHRLHQPEMPFVEVNCASIPPNLFESELFGYVGGAFTGALEKGRAGYFEIAEGGTIFLDEIGELPVEIQVKLLQVLQSKRFYRVGSSKPSTSNVRVIAATNIDLEQAVAQGRFRQDLYFRLNVFPIWMPPLRQQKSDLYLFVGYLLKNLCAEYGIETKQISGMALSKMFHYDWPGNVRELENILERAITICESQMIFPEHINIKITGQVETAMHQQSLKHRLEETEKKIMEDVLLQCKGDGKKAMRMLELSKTSFYEKVKKYGLGRDGL